MTAAGRHLPSTRPPCSAFICRLAETHFTLGICTEAGAHQRFRRQLNGFPRVVLFTACLPPHTPSLRPAIACRCGAVRCGEQHAGPQSGASGLSTVALPICIRSHNADVNTLMRTTRRKTGPEMRRALLRACAVGCGLFPQPLLLDRCKLAPVHQLPKLCRCGPSVAFLVRISIQNSALAAAAHHVVAAGAAWAHARLQLPLCHVQWLGRSLLLLCCRHNSHVSLCCSLPVTIIACGPRGTCDAKHARPRQGR